MDLIIKDSKFFIGQTVYYPMTENGVFKYYDPYWVMYIEIGENNKIVSIVTQHMSVINNKAEKWDKGRIQYFYAHNGELDELLIELPKEAIL